MCLLAICISSSEKYLFRFPAHFLIGFFVFWYWVVYILYIFWVLTPYCKSFANIFSYSVGCLFLLLMVSFSVQKHFCFMSLKIHMHPMFIAALFPIARIWKPPKVALIDEWIKKMWSICISNGLLLSHKEEWNLSICNNMDGLDGYNAYWNMSVWEKQMPYIFILM